MEDDPLAGLINLFDLWMVFSIALLLSLAVYLKIPPPSAGSTQSPATTTGLSLRKLISNRASSFRITAKAATSLAAKGCRAWAPHTV